ncbi:tyrosine-type recombinase/integrase [Streptomyces sp. DASNCL29]|uniref:tyrosine-type recombinase/integrase n=1 Tax=Streptomyces sp. DASNCL29 TaxID=2583819 RepID=UPI001F104B89|nr:tyrosine-type recombinase/integrase [Streptomyces sp. DASNCL29]
MWAGLTVESEDLPTADGRTYPAELIRTITLTWLFAGQRSDEVARLRVGCIRWQHDGMPIPGDSGEVLARDAVCLLDVPTHKTGTAFTKPVDPLLGKAIEAWQAVRPDQPAILDPKTNERADFLFAFRARRVSKHYINETIIPMLCRKAGVPTADVRGNVTSHRARSTIASQLYNAKEPMTLFERQEWLGHRTPEATAHYAKITPNTLAKAYNDAGYFARNLRHRRSPRRPRRRRLRRRRERRPLAVLRPRPRLVHLHLLRAVPAPHGLRTLRLLHPEGLQQGPVPGGRGEPAEDARRHPPDRRRTRRRRRRPGGPRPAASCAVRGRW